MAACTVRNLAYHTINTDPEQSVLGVNAAAAVVSGDSADHYDDPLREGAMTVLMMHVGTILDMLPGQADQVDVSVAEVLLSLVLLCLVWLGQRVPLHTLSFVDVRLFADN